MEEHNTREEEITSVDTPDKAHLAVLGSQNLQTKLGVSVLLRWQPLSGVYSDCGFTSTTKVKLELLLLTLTSSTHWSWMVMETMPLAMLVLI